MFELRNPKGTKDYLPDEQRIRRQIVRNLEATFEKYGYQPLETPILCDFEVLASKYAGGAEILKEVYHLKDQGERDLGLRYDLTVPFSKVIGMNPDVRMPFKRYEIGKVFRDGPVKLGRFREFTQCDVDMVGVKSCVAEAELISMAVKAFEQMGLKVYISYNNRKLLTGFLECCKVPVDMVNDVILTLDKIEKVPREAIDEELQTKGVSKDASAAIFKVLEGGKESFMEFAKNNLESSLKLKEGYEETVELEGFLEKIGLSGSTRLNPVLARGLDIYTGTVFEVFMEDGSITSSIGAGGRYDKIIGGFLDDGKEYPAVGISFGLDVIFKAIELKGGLTSTRPYDLFIIPMGTTLEALKLAGGLRDQGIKVDIEMMDRKLKKSLDYANKSNIPYVIILGENELDTQSVMIKDMVSSTETPSHFNEVAETLKKMEADR